MKAYKDLEVCFHFFLNLDARRRWVIILTARSRYFWGNGRASCNHEIRGWVGSRAGLDALKKGRPVTATGNVTYRLRAFAKLLEIEQSTSFRTQNKLPIFPRESQRSIFLRLRYVAVILICVLTCVFTVRCCDINLCFNLCLRYVAVILICVLTCMFTVRCCDINLCFNLYVYGTLLWY